jgi:enamine deaminase RidA (YjgF/YER057c/UK114 family)
VTHRILHPTGLYPATADYAHGVEVTTSRIVYTAGTMGLELDGRVPDGIDRQLELLWDNLRAILAAAGMTTDNIVRLTTYLADRADAEKAAAARVRALGGRAIPTTMLIATLLDPAWLVEIEVIAAA